MSEKTNELQNRLGGERIEWYPSAGGDMENVRSAFRFRNEPSPRPTIFIHTDWWYAEDDRDDFPEKINDQEIELLKVREYARFPAKRHGFCVFGREQVPNAGRCVEYEGIIRHAGRENRFSLIKIAIENEQFAAEFLLPNQIFLEAVIHKKCGWGCGGGATIPGTWMRGLLLRLKVKYFISDQHGTRGMQEKKCCENNLRIEKTFHERCRPGESEAGLVFKTLSADSERKLEFEGQWHECWELFSPHGSVLCFSVRTLPRREISFVPTTVEGEKVPVLNDYFDLLLYARFKGLCVNECSDCYNVGFKLLCRELGRDQLSLLIGRVNDDSIAQADGNPYLRRWVSSIDVLVREVGMVVLPESAILTELYKKVLDSRVRQAAEQKSLEEVRREQIEKRLAAERKEAERRRAEKRARNWKLHLVRKAAFRDAWNKRCSGMQGQSLESKLNVVAQDFLHLPEYYPIDLAEVKESDLDMFSNETVLKVLKRFSALRRSDWRNFYQLVYNVARKKSIADVKQVIKGFANE